MSARDPPRTGTVTVAAGGSTCTSPSAIGCRAWAASGAPSRVAVVISTRSPPTRDFSSEGEPSSITRPWSMTATLSASRSASSRYWVVSSTVAPRPTRRSIVSHIPSRLRGSRPVVGSSRKTTGGLATSAAARSRRRRMPPE